MLKLVCLHFRSCFVCIVHIGSGSLYDNFGLSLWYGIPKRNSYGSLPVTGCFGASYGPSSGLCSILDDRSWNLLFHWRSRSNHSIFDVEILQNMLISIFFKKKTRWKLCFYIWKTIFWEFFSHFFLHIIKQHKHSKSSVIRNPNKKM